jgi:hypothetical protein
MYARYAIGMSICGSSCWCVIITRRVADETAQGWSAIGGAIRTALQVAGGTAVAVAALTILRNPRSNSALVLWVLRALGAVLR